MIPGKPTVATWVAFASICASAFADVTSTATVTRDGDGFVHTFDANGTFATTEPLMVEVLVVGGGGGGGCGVGGGGGGGGVVHRQMNLPAGTYQVTVGQGGLGAQTTNDSNSFGANGGNSSFGDFDYLVAYGGGGGASWQANKGKSGATGGGSNNNYSGGDADHNVAGFAPQGYAGGKSGSRSSSGGGGAGGPGGDGDPAGANTQKAASAVGGAGVKCSITGTEIAYGGGGGGGGGDNGYCPGSPGTDGGGDGTDYNSAVAPGNGVDGRGGGGGGSGYASNVFPGGNGGSGIVIVAYGKSNHISSTAKVETDGNSKVYVFDCNGSFMTTEPLTADLLLVGGGGGGGCGVGGGGGGGGVIYKEGLQLPAGVYLVEVGLGGAGATADALLASNGGNSSFGDDLIAYGGGGGRGWGGNLSGADGATGGGGCGSGHGGQAIYNTETVIQGYPGGTPGPRSSSGGGGAGGPGGDGDIAGSGLKKDPSAVGGKGVKCSITGTEIAYGGGGGGGGGDGGACPGSPGTDGGGDGTDYNATTVYPGAGEDGRGGGGGGSGYSSGKYGGNGGRGTVILRIGPTPSKGLVLWLL